MKQALLYFFLFFAAISLYSQDSLAPADSAFGLKIQRYVHGQSSQKVSPYYISTGQKIRIRTHQNHHPKEGVLTSFTDSSLVIDSSIVFLFSDIWQISWYDQRIQNGGPILAVFGFSTAITGCALLFSPLFRFEQGMTFSEFLDVLAPALVGTLLIPVGIFIASAGLAVTEKGQWKMRELSPYWRISVSKLPPANKKIPQSTRRHSQ